MRTVRFSWCRLVGIFIAVILVVQLLTAVFISYLNAEPPGAQSNVDAPAERAEKVFEAMRARIDQDNAVMDSEGEYRLFQNVWFGKNLNRDVMTEDVGLVTHCTVNNMHYLVDMSKRWQGPMSIVIFAPGQDLIVALENILQLVWCVVPLRSYGSFHIISPMSLPARDIKPYAHYDDLLECRFIDRRMKSTLSIENYGFTNLNYPNNLLRNYGIESSLTEYVYVLDVDLLPSNDIRANFLEYARTHNLLFTTIPKNTEKVIYITPVFEAKEDYNIPDTKTKLSYKFGRSIRPFYLEPCPQCQRITDFERWLKVPKSPVLDVAYEVQWLYPYEPFYIVHRSVPFYNPTFKQYGFNRISQMCELHVAGYRFLVLNNAFVVHIGYKLPGKFHDTKPQEMKHNKILYNNLREELKLRYPNSSRSC